MINQRCILMARAEAEAITHHPDLGEEMYIAWVETMNIANPYDVNLNDWIDVLTVKYKVEPVIVRSLFEAIRLIIIQYDELKSQEI
ncbi:hypothetical protein NIES2101_36880 [Calothrix sp. HK-06]|nr:hypothetical protein NIES2101_36880 [Calothrix sp. HK-06]